jgi:hypothetical protein
MVGQLVWQLVLPALVMGILARSRFESRSTWLLNVVVLGLFLLLGFLIARWDWFSYYLRVLLFPLFGVVAYAAYRKIAPLSNAADSTRRWSGLAFDAVLLLAAAWCNVAVLRGYFYSGAAIRLASPLRNGVYYVGGGGSSRWLNAHRVDEAPGNDFALDIVALNGLGRGSTGLAPGELAAYVIYGRTVHSPCAGVVANAVDGVRDGSPPWEDRASPAGNHVVISCEGVKVVLAHLMHGSLAVARGEHVGIGQVIGRVGNSGRTSQPHLHLHAARGGSATGILDGEGVPIMVDGRFYTRNGLLRGR